MLTRAPAVALGTLAAIPGARAIHSILARDVGVLGGFRAGQLLGPVRGPDRPVQPHRLLGAAVHL
jgi:hypothetical protein